MAAIVDITTEVAPLIPREELFGNPERTQPQIAPDGRRLAYLAPVDGVLNVWLGTLRGDNFAPVTADTDRGIRSFQFAPDNRHLLYVQDRGGDENWHVYSVDLETRETTDVTPFEGVQAQIAHADPRFTDRVVLALNRDNPELHDLYTLNLASNDLDLLATNPGFSSWLVDAELQPGVGVRTEEDSGQTWLLRDASSGEWRELLRLEPDDSLLPLGPISFSRDGSSLLAVLSLDSDRQRLVRIDLQSGARAVLAEDPEYDIDSVMVNPDSLEPELAISLADRPRHIVIDPALREDVDALAALRPGSSVWVVSRDRADNTWIVATTAADGPTTYYAYDRQTRSATELFDDRPTLRDHRLAQMEPFWFTSRDGLRVEGYITAPVGVPRRGLPAVMYVHGGPWGRDVWQFEPTAQWFANRGYVSIQVNYRGSTGYGKGFVNASNREWAGRMHDDLIDGLEWVIAQGWVDRSRVAIYGGSYGGYAALVGATFTPDVFCCAVDIVGPSNLETLLRSIPPYWKPWMALWKARVGDPDTESEFLWSRSPLSRVDAISIPMLIAQGANDPRVKVAESEQIVDAMRAKGIPHEYMLFEDEGHGFAKPENRLRFLARAEAFLAEHLGGRVESPDSGMTR